MPRISAIRRSALRSEKKLIESSSWYPSLRFQALVGRPAGDAPLSIDRRPTNSLEV
jgi:hypothetical protein